MAERTTVDFQETAIRALMPTAGDAGVVRAIAAAHRVVLAVGGGERTLAEHNFAALMQAVERIYVRSRAIETPTIQTPANTLSYAVGIDLAWSSKNRTGVAVAAITADRVQLISFEWLTTNAEILALVGQLPRPLTIAIDAPTLVPNEEGQRPCELRLQTLFGRMNAGPYPSNRRLLGACNGGIPRGCELSQTLQRELGAVEGPLDARHSGVSVLEVFPAPALIRLLQLPLALPYKEEEGPFLGFVPRGIAAVSAWTSGVARATPRRA